SRNSDQETVVHELIKMVRAKGKVKDLVESAYQESPGSPLLHTFYHEVWIPLISPLGAVPSLPDVPHQEISRVLDFKAHRNRTEKSGIREVSQLHDSDEQSVFQPLNPSFSYEQRGTQQDALSLMRANFEIAYNSINTVTKLIQPEKSIYRD